jgi:DNA invertase Pin-like site-specific DNA recombinase
MKIGYARVSTDKQETKAQEAELLKYGCPKDKIFFETLSGALSNKPQLNKAIEQLREGDELVIWKLDRLSRSLKDLLFIVDRIAAAKATFTSLTEHLDTKGPGGTALMQMIGVFAQFERSMISERTKLGVRQAIADGKVVGRPSALDPDKKKHLMEMINSGQKTQAQMARIFGVNRSVISRMVSRHRVEQAARAQGTTAPVDTSGNRHHPIGSYGEKNDSKPSCCLFPAKINIFVPH